MLVALSVLGLLLGLLMQMATTTVSATNAVQEKIEASERSRDVLDAFAGDCLGLVSQNGSPFLLGATVDGSTSQSNTQFSFLTQSRGPVPDTRCLAVSYRLDNGNLVRYVQPIAWSPTGTFAQDALSASGGTMSVLAPGILRFVAVASLSDGTSVPLTPLPTESWAATTAQGLTVAPFVDLNINDGTQPRVRTITLAIAAVDAKNYQLLAKLNLLPAMAANLALPTAGQSPVEVWQPAIDTAASGVWAHVPRSVLAALQITQKTYQLPQ